MTMMREFDLVDVLREKNPKNKSYTHESKALKLCSQIYFYLIPQHQIKWVEQIETVVSNAQDQEAVILKLYCPNNKDKDYGNLTTCDEGFVTLIREYY